MAGWSTQETIKVSAYRGAQHPTRLIDEVEDHVRRTLEGAPHVEGEAMPTGDVMIGWLVTSSDVHGRGSTYRWVPGEELPADAHTLICRGRRYT